jgi:hypothetical protein
MEHNSEASVLTAEDIPEELYSCEDTKVATNESDGEIQPETLSKYGVYRHRDHRRMCDVQSGLPYLIEDMVRPRSVNIGVGDSGLGKSPFFYQMGLCLSAGVPFLGLKTERCRVLYVDLENPPDVSLQLKDSITRHLGLLEVPDDFLVCGFDGEFAHLTDQGFYQEVRPVFVVIDSLRAFDPEAERNNEDAAKHLNRLREIARHLECAFQLVHHTKKPGEVPVSLETTGIMQWLLQACGARALINQTDMRMAFGPREDESEVSLVWKYHLKAQGESGLFYTGRCMDEFGEPLGYRPVTGANLIDNPEQRAAFERLPPEFSFSDAKRTYGRADDPTSKFLKKCESLGLIQRVRRGRYRKVGNEGW